MSRKKSKKVGNPNFIQYNSNDPIFKYICPNNNDRLSDMSGLDLQEFIWYIENYYLELRERLGFDSSITFGLELEFEQAMRNRICDRLKQYFHNDSWKIKDDDSLDDGAEINSPILKDTEKSWKDLQKVCEIVEENACIGENSWWTYPCWNAGSWR